MTSYRLADISETELIQKIIKGRLPASDSVLVDNGDDAAVWRVEEAGTLLVASTDSLVEGVHYRELNEATGRKLMAVNLSDLASMGANPSYALLSLHLDPKQEVAAIERMADGLHQRAHEFGVQLIGGNVTRTSGPAVLALTLIGQTTNPICRGQARPGDGVFVTGTLGDARAGLEVESGELFKAQVDPIPRVSIGIAFSECESVTSMCDISDGLAKDVRQLIKSELGVRLEESKLPLSKALQDHAGPQATQYALLGGEDYELLFTASDEVEVKAAGLKTGTLVTRIGDVLSDSVFEIVSVSGEIEMLTGGFDHFGQNLSE